MGEIGELVARLDHLGRAGKPSALSPSCGAIARAPGG